jgi:hypothetical protein
MNAELREELERARRARLHRQIGALTKQLRSLDCGRSARYTVARIKLQHTIARLEMELEQPLLLPPPPRP